MDDRSARAVGCLVIFLLVLFVGIPRMLSIPSPSPKPETNRNVTPSEQVDARIVESLERKCKNSRAEIIEIVTKGQRVLYDRGVFESLSDFATHIDQSIPAEMPDNMLDIEEVTAAYIALRAPR